MRSLAIEAGGQAVATRALPCDDYAMKPCPDDVWLDSSFDTTRLPDGEATIVIRAVDAGGQAVEDRATVTIDNVPPTVAAPEIRGGSGWRSTNAFELSVDARDGLRGSGVRSVAWEVCRTDGTECVPGSAAGSPASIAVTVPGPGEWQARAWATDAVRSGAKSPWSAPLRLDDAAPGRAAVDAGGRWSTGSGPRARRAEPAADRDERAFGRRGLRRRARPRRPGDGDHASRRRGRSSTSATCRRA